MQSVLGDVCISNVGSQGVYEKHANHEVKKKAFDLAKKSPNVGIKHEKLMFEDCFSKILITQCFVKIRSNFWAVLENISGVVDMS